VGLVMQVLLNNKPYTLAQGHQVRQTMVQPLSQAIRDTGLQRRSDNEKLMRLVDRMYPLGIGWSRMDRETQRGEGGLRDATVDTGFRATTLGRLQENQTAQTESGQTPDHLRGYGHLQGELWAIFEPSVTTLGRILVRRFVASTSTWTAPSGGGMVWTDGAGQPEPWGLRVFDMKTHKGRLFEVQNRAEEDSPVAGEERYHVLRSPASIETHSAGWTNADGTGFPTSDFLPTAITRRSNFDDDMARLLDFGNVLFAALWAHPDSGDGDGTIKVYRTTDLGATWTAGAVISSVDGPKAMVVWSDPFAAGHPAIPILITSEGIYKLTTTDATFTVLFPFDANPDNGRRASVGPDGALYVGLADGKLLRLSLSGTGLIEHIVVGPPGDGFVSARQGHVNFVLPTNSEWLLVSYGGHVSGKNASIFKIDTSVIFQDPITGKRFMPWHHVHLHGTANVDLYHMATSNEDDGTPRLHFALEGSTSSVLRHIAEPLTDPDSGPAIKYQSSSFLRRPSDDLGDPQTTAGIFQSLVDAELTASETIQLQDGLDGAADDTNTRGTFNATTPILVFGEVGVAAKKWAARLNFARGGTNTNTPKLYEFEVDARNKLLDLLAFDLPIDIAKTADATRRSEEQVIADLIEASRSPVLVPLEIGRFSTNVEVRLPPEFSFEVRLSSAGVGRERIDGTCVIRVEEVV
jgi:hypothetical protein